MNKYSEHNTNIVELPCYKTSDGKLHECRSKARDHQSDIVGELLDVLLPHDDRGNISQCDRFNLILEQLKDDDLNKKITALYNALNPEY